MKLSCAVGCDPVRNEILLAIWLLLSQHWLRAKTATALAHLSHRNSVSLSVCHMDRSVKNGASLDHQIFTISCLEESSFRNRMVVLIEKGGGKNLQFLANKSLYLSNGARYGLSYY